jgi:hypothetical protein
MADLTVGLEQDAIHADRVHAAGPRGGDGNADLFDVGRLHGLLTALREDDGRTSLLAEIDDWRDRLFRQVRTFRSLLLDQERDALRVRADELAAKSQERLDLWRRTDEELRVMTEQRNRVLRLLQERSPNPFGRSR